MFVNIVCIVKLASVWWLTLTLLLAGQEILSAALADPSNVTVAAGGGLYGPLTLQYSATDVYGSVARTTRTLYINASCEANESLCPGSPVRCSQSGACLSDAAQELLGLGSNSKEGSTAQSTYQPPKDTAPPVITMIGAPPEHQRAVSPATGKVILITTHVAGTPYEDPGATAYDFIDKDLTAAISAHGLKAVKTRALSGRPTPRAQPMLVQYAVSDAAGNAAEPAIRRVKLLCPRDSAVCQDDADEEQWYCSNLGACLGVSNIGSSPSLTEVEPAAVELVGPATVHVVVGQVRAGNVLRTRYITFNALQDATC